MLFRKSLIRQTKAGGQNFRLQYQPVSEELLTRIRYICSAILGIYFATKCNKPRIERHQVIGCSALLRQQTGLSLTFHFQYQPPATDHLVIHENIRNHILLGIPRLFSNISPTSGDLLPRAAALDQMIGSWSLIPQMEAGSLSFLSPYQRTFRDVVFSDRRSHARVSRN